MFCAGNYGEAYEVVEAANGHEVLQLLLTVVPALVLLDCMMPKMNGLAFREALHSEGKEYMYPVVALSASGSAKHFAQQIHAVDYLEKPFRLASLLGSIPRWMAGDSEGE